MVMNMKKWIRTACIFAVLLLSLCGCGGGGGSRGADAPAETEAEDTGSNIVTVKKDGVIVSTLEEAFAGEYFDEETLKQFVLQEAADYNAEEGGDKVVVKKLEIKKERASLTMEYRTAEDYAGFNRYPFFYGTVAEAYEAGYDLDVTFTEADGKLGEDGESPSIGKDELLTMGSRRIIIAQVPKKENLTVKTSGKILYINGAELVKKNIASAGSDTDVITTYIVFK